MKKFNSEHELRDFLIRRFELNYTRSEEIIKWLADNEIEHSDKVNFNIYASINNGADGVILKKWLIRFIFSEKDNLKEIEINQGFIGP